MDFLCIVSIIVLPFCCCEKTFYGPLSRYIKSRVAHAPGMPGTFSPPPWVSDPDMHHCTFDAQVNKKPSRTLPIWSKANWDMLKEKSRTFCSDFLASHGTRDIHQNWEAFNNHMQDLRKSIPSKKTSSRYNLPWLSSDVKRMCRKKRRLYRKARRSKDHWVKFYSHQEATGTALRKAHWEYVNSILLDDLDNGNKKSFWSYIKAQKQDNVGVSPLRKGRQLLSDSKSKAQLLSDQFKSVFTIDTPETVGIRLRGPNYPPIDDLIIKEDGVLKLLQGLNPSKASGPDEIPARLLKNLATELTPAITEIFRQSVLTGALPESWKQAWISPVYKKGNRNDPANYRPLLFLLHINEMPSVVDPHTQCRLFADDCLLYRVVDSLGHQIQLQQDLAALEAWACDWGMQFNASKCHVMVVNKGQSHRPFLYQLCGTILDSVSREKYLGVLLSQEMSWSPHIGNIVAKAHQKLGFIRRNLRGSPQDCKRLAYIALVRSGLEYASIIWDPTLKKDTEALERVQRKAARWVTSTYETRASVSKLLKDMQWETLETRRRQQRLAFLYKILKEQVAVPAKSIDLTYSSRASRGTARISSPNRHSINLQVPAVRAAIVRWYRCCDSPRLLATIYQIQIQLRCMPGSLTSGFLWSQWRGKRSRHSRRMRNSQFYVFDKRPIAMMTKLLHMI